MTTFNNNKEFEAQLIRSRIALLRSRAGAENGNIIKKLERRLRKISA